MIAETHRKKKRMNSKIKLKTSSQKETKKPRKKKTRESIQEVQLQMRVPEKKEREN